MGIPMDTSSHHPNFNGIFHLTNQLWGYHFWTQNLPDPPDATFRSPAGHQSFQGIIGQVQNGHIRLLLRSGGSENAQLRAM